MVLSRGLRTAIQEKKRAALLSIGSAALLLCLKTFLVIRIDSLGILSEALHSGLDLVAAIITFLSVRVSDQPADERHPYGHGKFENFSAFIETGLLLLTAVYIIYEAFHRLFFHSVHIQPSVTAILILLVALSIDLTRARTLNVVAKRYSSEALEADALHFSTDVWSTIVVILGVALVWAGNVWSLPWLAYADSLAGLAVAGVILWVGSQLGRRTLDALLDAAPAGLQDQLVTEVGNIEGVLHVERVRLRRAGNRYFVDTTVSVARTANLEQVHALTDKIEKRIAQIVPADVIVHAEPRAPRDETLFESVRAVLLRGGDVVHSEPEAESDSADGFEQCLIARGAGFCVNDDVGGNNLGDALFDFVGEGVNLLEIGGAGNADGGVHKVAVAGAAEAHAFHLENSFNIPDLGNELILQPSGSRVEKGVESAAAEL